MKECLHFAFITGRCRGLVDKI